MTDTIRIGPALDRPFTPITADGVSAGEVQLRRNPTAHGLDMYVGFYRSSKPIATTLDQEFDEAMYVMEGSIEFETEDGVLTVAAGQCAFVPKGFSCPIRQSAGFRSFIVTLP